MILPRYGSGTLGEVLPSALGAMGVGGWDNVLGLPAAETCVVLLVDGLGWNLLRRYSEQAPFLNRLAELSAPITCGVPSTTATSLTSLGTALPPGRHGMVGFTSWIPGTSRLLEALKWDPKVDPLAWQPHETVFERAGRQGVLVSAVSRRMFAKSGLTAVGQRGARYEGADFLGERIAAAVGAAAAPGSLVYLYDGELDATGHRRGCESADWRYQLAATDWFCSTLREALPATATLVVTADHGMVDVAPQHRLDLDECAELVAGVRLVGGEARFRHVYCEDGESGAVAVRWRDRLGAQATVRLRDDAVDEGWFGAVDDRVLPRLGDLVVASVGAMAVVSTRRFPHEAKLAGLHGSLSDDEMLIPLLVAEAG